METLKSDVETKTPIRSGSFVVPEIPGYDVLDLIGRGGMGRVYRARDLKLGRFVAIKVLVNEADQKLLARFREEARAVASLQHPNIAALFETGDASGLPFFSQELIEGGALSQKWNGQPQESDDVAKLVEQIARALEYCHQSGILHRDIKPSNILLTTTGQPKVTDFGLAKELNTASHDRTSNLNPLTMTGEVIGTPGYMSPEQATGVMANIGPATDIYALGALLYEGLTGRPPFQAADPMQTLLMVLTTDPIPPSTLVPKVPRDLETICLKCLQKSTKKRYATAQELADDLQRFQQGKTIIARPAGQLERAVKWTKRNKLTAVLSAFATLMFLFFIVFATNESLNAQRVKAGNSALAAKNQELSELNEALLKSKQETDQLLTYTLEAFDNAHFHVAEKLIQIPQGDPIRLELLKNAAKTLDKIYTLKEKQHVRDYLADAYTRLGNVHSQLNQLTESEFCYRRSLEMLTQTAAADPDSVTKQANKIVAMSQLSMTLQPLNRMDEVHKLHENLEQESTELLKKNPQNPTVLRAKLQVEKSVFSYEMTKNIDDKLYFARVEKLVSLYSRLVQVEPDVLLNHLNYVDLGLSLVNMVATENKLAEAHAMMKSFAPSIDKFKNDTQIKSRSVFASTFSSMGILARAEHDYQECDRLYRKSLEINQKLHAEFPERVTLAMRHAHSWSGIALNLVDCKKFDEAHAALNEARKIVAELKKQSPDNQSHSATLAQYDQTDKYIRDAKAESAKQP